MNFEENSTTTDDLYFFDTYAFIDILKGNRAYDLYIYKPVLLTKLNLFEVIYYLLRKNKPREAQIFLNAYYPLAVDFDPWIIVEAAAFKLRYKKRKLSMADCIGYKLAEQWGIPFLTGDKGFRGMKNVEYVK